MAVLRWALSRAISFSIRSSVMRLRPGGQRSHPDDGGSGPGRAGEGEEALARREASESRLPIGAESCSSCQSGLGSMSWGPLAQARQAEGPGVDARQQVPRGTVPRPPARMRCRPGEEQRRTWSSRPPARGALAEPRSRIGSSSTGSAQSPARCRCPFGGSPRWSCALSLAGRGGVAAALSRRCSNENEAIRPAAPMRCLADAFPLWLERGDVRNQRRCRGCGRLRSRAERGRRLQ